MFGSFLETSYFSRGSLRMLYSCIGLTVWESLRVPCRSVVLATDCRFVLFRCCCCCIFHLRRSLACFCCFSFCFSHHLCSFLLWLLVILYLFGLFTLRLHFFSGIKNYNINCKKENVLMQNVSRALKKTKRTYKIKCFQLSFFPQQTNSGKQQ